MNVRKPEELKQVTDSVLSGLIATEELKSKIVYSAAQQKIKPEKVKNSGFLRFVPALCCCLALIVCLCSLVPQMKSVTAKPDDFLPAITDRPAGNISPENEGNLRNGTELSPEGRKVTSETGKQGIFSDTVPEIVVLDGCFYQLINDVFNAEQLKLSTRIGKVDVFDTFSTLSGGEKAGSTFLKEGTEVYSLDGMNHAFVATEDQGNIYVFQRVALEQHGLLANEKIQDVLPDPTHIVSMDLQEKGTITDCDTIGVMMDLLCKNAVSESNNPLNRGEYLILHLDNGLSYQMTVNQQRISFCGTWLCPEFTDMLDNHL